MAALSVEDRTKVWRGLMRFLSKKDDEFPMPATLTKYDLYNPSTNTGAIADTDNWIDTHAGNICDTTGYNGSLSEPFKSNASVALKTLVFIAVASMRQGVWFVKSIFGEVD